MRAYTRNVYLEQEGRSPLSGRFFEEEQLSPIARVFAWVWRIVKGLIFILIITVVLTLLVYAAFIVIGGKDDADGFINLLRGLLDSGLSEVIAQL